MQAFRFNLEKVLKVRQLEALKAKQALAMAQLSAGQAWVALERARAGRIQYEAELEQRRRRGMPQSEWMATAEQHDRYGQAEKAAAESLHQALALVAERRAEAEESDRRVKALEKLREQQLEAHVYAENAAEQAITDEVAQNVARAGKGAG